MKTDIYYHEDYDNPNIKYIRDEVNWHYCVLWYYIDSSIDVVGKKYDLLWIGEDVETEYSYDTYYRIADAGELIRMGYRKSRHSRDFYDGVIVKDEYILRSTRPFLRFAKHIAEIKFYECAVDLYAVHYEKYDYRGGTDALSRYDRYAMPVLSMRQSFEEYLQSMATMDMRKLWWICHEAIGTPDIQHIWDIHMGNKVMKFPPRQ